MRYLSIIILLITTTCFSQLEISSIYQNNKVPSKRTTARRAANDTLTLPISENFASLTYSNTWLENNGVYLNNHFAENQPSIGVLTLDGVDGTGEPYVFSTQKTTAIGIGDNITSNCINLEDINTTDGLAMSFFWQQGTPDDPNRDPLWESGERLRLLFKDSTETFRQVWPNDEIVNRIIATGLTADTFYLENILVDERYLHDGFQFKFEYYGTLLGNYGVFNVDNINLDTGIATIGADTTFRTIIDYAISLAPRTFLNEYSSVPLNHFLAADENIIDDSIFTSVYSLGELFITDTDSSIQIIDTEDGSLLYSKGSDDFSSIDLIKGVPSEINWELDQATIKAGIDATISTEKKTFKTLLSIVTPDFIATTDSASTTTELSDYYAYDDGTMEAGLGLRGVGEFVQAFDFILSDTLKGFYVYFPKYGLDLSNTFFTYKIYETLEGINGNTKTELLYEQNDVVTYFTDESDSSSLNKFLYIPLSTEQLVNPGRYYFGIAQDTDDKILIGLDYSIDRSEHIFYRLFTDPWKSFKDNGGIGTAAIRPVMGSDNFTTPVTVTPEIPTARIQSPSYIYPNPGNGTFIFDDYVENLTVFNTNGLEVYTTTVNGKTADLSILEEGFYLIQLQTGNIVNTTKLFINQ